MSRPRILILGHARHGKDTVGELLRDNHGYRVCSSSLFAAERVVRPALAAVGIEYATVEDCYADRVNWRGFWYEAISAYNRGGSSRLARAILVDHDCYIGMRSAREYEASRSLFDVVVWVDATGRGVPLESATSMDIRCDLTNMYRIENNGTLDDLADAVRGFSDSLA